MRARRQTPQTATTGPCRSGGDRPGRLTILRLEPYGAGGPPAGVGYSRPNAGLICGRVVGCPDWEKSTQKSWVTKEKVLYAPAEPSPTAVSA